VGITEQREGKMSKFKVGDRVTIIQRNNACLPLGSIHVVSDFSSDGYVFVKDGNDGSWCLMDEVLELIEEKEMPDTEKKYKITTGLDFYAMDKLKILIGCTPKAGVLQELYVELVALCKEAQRKVVKVGDREYYEDELSAALANIKPIK
jgi:hypothetical protein